jgi:hypothetical protein
VEQQVWILSVRIFAPSRRFRDRHRIAAPGHQDIVAAAHRAAEAMSESVTRR